MTGQKKECVLADLIRYSSRPFVRWLGTESFSVSEFIRIMEEFMESVKQVNREPSIRDSGRE